MCDREGIGGLRFGNRGSLGGGVFDGGFGRDVEAISLKYKYHHTVEKRSYIQRKC